MRDFLFRLKVSLALIWLNGCAYTNPKVRRYAWRWLCNGLRDLWNENLDGYYCCAGFGADWTHCACQGVTWREYWDAQLEYHWS